MSWDPDLDLDLGVLHDRLKITDPDALATAEAVFTGLRIAEIGNTPIPGRYDLPHLQAIHWHVASDVYFFAGRLRTVRLGKGGHAFCPRRRSPPEPRPCSIDAPIPAVCGGSTGRGSASS